MFQRVIDDVKTATGTVARQTVLIGAVAVSLFVTTGFLSAAAFVVMLQRYGLVEACLTGAAIFFVVTLISAGSYLAMRRSPAGKVVEEAKSATESFMPNPAMLITGLQIARAIGFRRLLPVIALGGLALGALAARGLSSSNDHEPEEAAD